MHRSLDFLVLWYLDENIEVVSNISFKITEIIEKHNAVDWQTSIDIHNKIAQDIDDLFYELEKGDGLACTLNGIQIGDG